jgi:hypothetical protein
MESDIYSAVGRAWETPIDWSIGNGFCATLQC